MRNLLRRFFEFFGRRQQLLRRLRKDVQYKSDIKKFGCISMCRLHLHCWLRWRCIFLLFFNYSVIHEVIDSIALDQGAD